MVTGGAGFIGSHLCEALLEKGYRVFCVDDFSKGREENLVECKKNKNFSLMTCNINSGTGKIIFEENHIDYVVHLASIVGVKTTEKDQLAVLDDIDTTRFVLHYARENKVKKVISASSSEVYGETYPLLAREEGYVNPVIPYAVMKLMGEKYCEAYLTQKGLATVSMRYFNIYGPRQRSDTEGFVVGIFIEHALKNKPLPIFGDGSQTRTFMYIKDCVEATIRLMESDDVGVFNIGSDKEYKIIALAKKINSLINKTTYPLKMMPMRKVEYMKRCPVITKMKEKLKFKPKYGLERGLKETIEWYRDQ